MIDEKLRRLLNQVFDRIRGGETPRSANGITYDQARYDFGFHLTDWMRDLERLRALFQNPEKYDAKTASLLIDCFLIHVIPHLNAAGRLLLDEISDPFTPAPEEKRPPLPAGRKPQRRRRVASHGS